MNDTEKEENKNSESSESKGRFGKKREKKPRKTQGQMIQEVLGLNAVDIQDIEKKLFIVRFLDFYSEETLQFIFKDNNLNQYIKQIATHINDLGVGREEDKLLKQNFESRDIVGIINKLKGKAEELAISKGVTTSVEKRLRKLTFLITLPMFGIIIVLTILNLLNIFPELYIYFLLPVLCVFCMVPQLIRGSVVKKWFAFKDEYKHQVYADNREDIMILKNFAGELLENIRTRLIELKVPLQLIKFVLHSQDYESLNLINQKNIRGTMQYVYTFNYPSGVEPLPIPQELQQYEQPLFPEKKVRKEMEKNFIVLTEMKGTDGIITSFIPTLKDNLADKINEILNNSEFVKASKAFEEIIPNYSELLPIYCVCGEVAEIKNVQICNWKDQFKFYLFEGKKCNCGDKIYALSLMDENTEVPNELKEVFGG
ncbi:MAG: hypothetical protein ACFFEY_14460 [Candidatus Thorarchaeota archaeon]